VIELVTDCKVNRNTFYYHFKDLPALMAEIAKRGIDSCLAACKGGAAEKLNHTIERMAQNKLRILHVYSADERAVFDSELAWLCEYLAGRLFAKNTDGDCTESFRLMLVKSCLYGLVSDWLAKSLDEECIPQLTAACAELAKYIEE